MKVVDALKDSRFVVTRLTPSQVGALGVIGILGEEAGLILNAHFEAYSKSSIQTLDIGSLVAGDWHHTIVMNQSVSGFSRGHSSATSGEIRVRCFSKDRNRDLGDSCSWRAGCYQIFVKNFCIGRGCGNSMERMVCL